MVVKFSTYNSNISVGRLGLNFMASKFPISSPISSKLYRIPLNYWSIKIISLCI
uniref:Uncharacterized protein n=1 Tax=Arundo donax TaxID=35708 RepID=A0A0A9CIR3_ARUDO